MSSAAAGLRIDALFQRVQAHHTEGSKKITIVGCGAVGLACAYSILNQGVASRLTIIDIPACEERVRGEVADLVHGSAFSMRCEIVGGSDYALTADSDLVVITAGARQNPGESRMSLVDRNVKIFRSIIPPLVKASPRTVIMVVSNPVDIMTYVVHKLSGFAPGRVFGSGTSLDSSRFRTLVAERLGIDARSVHGMILGEHGDTSIALWSALSVGGMRLRDINSHLGMPDDPDGWEAVHRGVVNAG